MLTLQWTEDAQGRLVPTWEPDQSKPGEARAAYVPSATYRAPAPVEDIGWRVMRIQTAPRFDWGTAMASFVAR